MRPTDTELSAWRAFLRAHAGVVGKLGKELQEECDLPLGWYEVLLLLREAPDQRLRMTELADSLLLSKSAVTRFIDRLETAGLVCRTKCPSDKRGYFVSITDTGYSELKRSAPVHLRGISEHFVAHLTVDELALIEKAMTRVAESL